MPQRLMTEYTNEVLLCLIQSATDFDFEPHSFLQKYHTAEKLCKNDTDCLKFSDCLIKILGRARILYFSMLSCKELSEGTDLADISDFRKRCFRLCACGARLFGFAAFPERSKEDYVRRRNLVIARIHSAIFDSHRYRVASLERNKRIFSALGELEVIYSCTEAIKKAEALIIGIDAVNNKFTLCT